MPANREMLEGEAYWGRIKSIKRKLYALEVVLMIVMGAVLVISSQEFSLDPLLLPFDKLLGFILIMILIIMMEGFVFRIMQVQICKSDSTKHIMSTNSIRRGIIIAIIAAIIAVLLLFPGMTANVESTISYNGTVTHDGSARFQNKDPMALSSVVSVTIHCKTPAKVYLVSQFLLDHYPGDLVRDHALNKVILANPDVQINMTSFGYGTYYIFVWGANSSGDANATAEYTLHTELSNSVTTLVPIVAIIMAISNAAWIGYLVPLRNKCRGKSIYK